MLLACAFGTFCRVFVRMCVHLCLCLCASVYVYESMRYLTCAMRIPSPHTSSTRLVVASAYVCSTRVGRRCSLCAAHTTGSCLHICPSLYIIVGTVVVVRVTVVVVVVVDDDDDDGAGLLLCVAFGCSR